MLAACDGGLGTREVALKFNCSESWVRRVKQERREQGKVAPKLTRTRRRDWDPHADWLREQVAAKPDPTLMELVTLAATQRDWKTSDATICRALHDLRLTLKNDAHSVRARPRGRCVETSGVDRLTKRLDPDRVVFLDETWAKTNLMRTRGRCERGSRLVEKTPCGRWSTTTFLGAIRSRGVVAPLCVDGAINGRVFKAWVERRLVRELKPGDMVVMDNLSSHQVGGVAEAIEGAGAEVRYLPPFSPDLNPIELAFSKVKRRLRDGARRTQEGLVELCGRVLELFTDSEIRNSFRHRGYR